MLYLKIFPHLFLFKTRKIVRLITCKNTSGVNTGHLYLAVAANIEAEDSNIKHFMSFYSFFIQIFGCLVCDRNWLRCLFYSFSSVQFSSAVSDSFQLHGLQHTGPPVHHHFIHWYIYIKDPATHHLPTHLRNFGKKEGWRGRNKMGTDIFLDPISLLY